MSKEEKEIKNNEASEKPAKEKKSFNKRKFKYGSLAAAITVVFIAAVVLLNILATQLTDRYGLKIDTTKEQLFEISDQTIDYLHTLEEDIEIAVMTDEETLDNGSKYYKLVKEVIEKYAQNSSKIKVNYYDTEKNPEVVTKFSTYTSDQITRASIVVFCNGRIKVLEMRDLYEIETNYQTYEQTIKSITAEEKLTSAVIFVADPNPPKVAILTCQQSQAVAASVSQISAMFESNGYNVETVDPLTQDISDEFSVAVLAAPYSDVTVSVTEKLDAFLDNGGKYGKNLLYLASFDQRETPNLDAFLEEWGIKAEEGYVSNVNGAEMIKVAIAGLQNYYAVPQAKLTEGNEGFVKSAELPVAMPMARPLTLLPVSGDGRETEVLLKTSESSVIITKTTTNDDVNSLEKSEQNVLVRADKHRFEGQEKISSNIIACGSAFALDYYITSTNSLNNQELFVNIINSCSGKEAGITVLSKSLIVDNISISEQAFGVVVLLVQVVLPLAVALAGIAVYLRRRNR